MQITHLRSILFIVLSNLLLPVSARSIDCRDSSLAKKYAHMHDVDQALRGKYIEILEKENAKATIDQAEKDRLEILISETDEKNRIELERMIKTCGWPKDLDGNRAAFSAFLIIQHAPLPYQLKYFAMIKAANSRGEISNEHLAWLIDRVLVRQGKPQRYGTEFEYGSNKIFPIEDSKNVNKRRKKMGLPPLKEFPL